MLVEKIKNIKPILSKKPSQSLKIDRSSYFGKINFGKDILKKQRELRDNE